MAYLHSSVKNVVISGERNIRPHARKNKMLEIKPVDRTITAAMKNTALMWLKSKLPQQSGQIVFVGLWQDAWKLDFPSGESPKTRAVLALYEDATPDAHALLDHFGVYCEVTLDPAATAQRRAWAARFSNVSVSDDGKQRYLWAMKSGRSQ